MVGMRSRNAERRGESCGAARSDPNVALINAERGRALGFVNARLYSSPALLKPITSGDNMDFAGLGYSAGVGWNACAGLGSPNGAALIAALTAVA